MHPIAERDATAPEDFAAIRRAGEPVVMRGLARAWPLVEAARQGRAPDWLRSHATSDPVPFMRAPPEVEGRLHYREAVEGRNFSQETAPLAAYLDALEAEAVSERPDALALQGMPASERLPRFAETHRLDILPPRIPPRLWIGNRAKVAIHHDPAENVAVVAAGRRRFTLFPPEAVGDLYMGPFHDTPAGVQVSLVHLTQPDLERYPRFAQALKVGLEAELEPGDALYIPFQWYHHVEALEPVNVLVNYWWDAAPRGLGSASDAMLHGLMSLSTLPPDQRRAWRAMFDHYVFRLDGDPAEHIPEAARGALTSPTPQSLAAMRRALIAALSKD
ncbi:cupin-like domain-containing protein [Brevundimonas sp.]|uniref:cupin-like domain-containing protein n=1 Tax=Brevundimonas sp. TaxID=1871086 RepID=UPI0035B1E4AB